MAMNDSSLERVQRDLNLMKTSLAADFPYDRGSVVSSGIASLCAGFFAVRAIPGRESAATIGLYIAIVGLAAYSAAWWKRAGDRRGARPRRWKWGRQEATAAAAVILATGFYVVSRRMAASPVGLSFVDWRDQLAGPLIFALGVGTTAASIVSPERRFFLGWGVALAGSALAMPWIDSLAGVRLVGGTAMALGGGVSTALLWIETRRREAAHGGH
jgi:hypothetical protein